MKSPLSILIVKLVGAAFVTGLLMLTSVAAYAGTQVRYFKSIITPSGVQAGSTAATFSIEVTNCGASACGATTSTKDMGTATIAVPPGFTSVTLLSTSAAGGAKNWDTSLNGTTIKLIANPGTDKLSPGESVIVSFTANAPCTAGSYEWTTVGYQGVDEYDTPYDLYGSQPTVEVTGNCQSFSGWQSGDYCTYGQGAWGTDANGNNPGSIRDNNFGTVYPSGVSVGEGYSMTFETSGNVNNFLPGCKTPAALTSSLLNPQSFCGQEPNTTGGIFGAQVLAFKLNSDFNAADVLASNLHNFGSVILVDTNTSLDGKTIADILDRAETALGGGALPLDYTISQLNTLVDAINQAFSECEPSEWAQAHLIP